MTPTDRLRAQLKASRSGKPFAQSPRQLRQTLEVARTKLLMGSSCEVVRDGPKLREFRTVGEVDERIAEMREANGR